VFGRVANKFPTKKPNTSQREGVGYSKYGNEPSGSTRFVEFLEHLRAC